jgi:peptide/nickel transport system substrate-binding protein
MSDSYEPTWFSDAEPVTRRKLLQVGGAGLLALGGSGVLAACGGGTTSSTSGTSGGGAPVHGGTLHFGAQGGANTDTLEADNVLTNTDYARASQLYDPLVRMNDQGQPELALAQALEPNKTATEWTIRIRDGVAFHDGKPLTAQDVLFTFDRIIKNNFPGKYALGSLDVGASKVLDPHTLRLIFSSPYATLLDGLALHWYLYIVPTGYDHMHPVGTGPFKLVSFTPGQQSVMARNPDYWDHPKPYLDKVITINVAEETAQINGLESGQFDAIDYLTAGSVASLKGSSSANLVISSKTGGWEPFTMRVDRTPYSDVRVRTALKLVIDRPAMINSVFAGYGHVGNDVFGIYDKDYDPSLLPQRHQDLEQAKSLLKSAGYSDLPVQLITTPNAPGMVQAAEIFASQAPGAGIRTNVVNQPVTAYFNNSYLKVPFSEDYWPYQPYLTTVSQDSITGAPFSATHFNDAHYNSLYKQALSTLDTSLRREIKQEMWKIDYYRGGNIIPFFFPVIDAVAPHVYGVEPTVSGQAMRTFKFQEFWMKQ